MLRLATSGLSVRAGPARSATAIVAAPPLVRLITTFDACLMRGRNFANASGVWSGAPVFGSRACRCTIAAPASAAPMAASAIWSGVTGKCGDIDGVWIEPVTAHVMTTLLGFAMFLPPLLARSLFLVGRHKSDGDVFLPVVGLQRHGREGASTVGGYADQFGCAEVFALQIRLKLR